MSSSAPADSPADFPPTEWSRIQVLRDRTHAAYQPTLNRFVEMYWRPVFYFLRTRGASVHQAEDWTQEFLLGFAIGGTVAKADEQRGRMRTFLLRVLRNFVADQGDTRTTRQNAFERQGMSMTFSLGEEERSWEPAGESPDDVYERRWAAEVIDGALRQLRELAPADWPIFEAYRLADGDQPSQDALAQRFGTTRDEVRKILKRAEGRFERLLRAELREEGVGEAEMDDEVGSLLRALAK